MKKRRNNGGYVFSTDPNFSDDKENDGEETLPPEDQNLRVQPRKLKGNKIATYVTGFVGTDDDLTELGKELKNKCGVGGSAKDGEIILQGEKVDKVVELLNGKGYKAKRSGG